jgi:hypothetical protein
MHHYSDPTAARALGGINREFSRLEKKAKNLCRLLDEGKITQEAFEKANDQFTGIYRHVLTLTKRAWDAEKQKAAAAQGRCA